MIVTSKQGEYLSSGCKEKQRSLANKSITGLMRRKGWPLQHGKKLMTKQKPSLKGLGIEDLEEIPSFNAGHFLWREHRPNQDLANNTVQ